LTELELFDALLHETKESGRKKVSAPPSEILIVKAYPDKLA